MIFPRVGLSWLLIALVDRATTSRRAALQDSDNSSKIALNKVVVFDWDETLSRITVLNEFPADSPDARFNLPRKLMDMVMEVKYDYDDFFEVLESPLEHFRDHVWYEFAGVYDRLPNETSSDEGKSAEAQASNDSSVAASQSLVFPSRVSKLKDFLQVLADAGNVAVLVLSNTRMGPDFLVAMLKYLGLDGFFDGVFAGLPDEDSANMARMMYMRNDGGSWSSPSEIIPAYTFNKVEVLTELIEQPGNYLGKKYDSLRTSYWFGKQIPPEDVLLIDDLEYNCETAKDAGFQSYHVKRTKPMKPESGRRTPAGFGAGLNFDRDFGCGDGSPLSLLWLCPGQQENYWMTRGI